MQLSFEQHFYIFLLLKNLKRVWFYIQFYRVLQKRTVYTLCKSGFPELCLPNEGCFLLTSVSSLCPLSLLAAHRSIYHRPSPPQSETYGDHYPLAPHILHFPTALFFVWLLLLLKGPSLLTNTSQCKIDILFKKKRAQLTWHFRPSTGPRSSVNSCPKVKSMSKFLNVVTVFIFILPVFTSCSMCLLGFRMQTTFLNA